MAQYIDKDALVAEIKKIYNEDYKFLPSDIAENIQDFKDDVLRNIDTLEVKVVDLEKESQRMISAKAKEAGYSKPANEDLEGAAKKYADEEEYGDDVYYSIKATFKEGANWQKEQMMKDAINAEVAVPVYEGKDLKLTQLVTTDVKLNVGDKVKLIIIKD